MNLLEYRTTSESSEIVMAPVYAFSRFLTLMSLVVTWTAGAIGSD
jgi:hypothetical protein